MRTLCTVRHEDDTSSMLVRLKEETCYTVCASVFWWDVLIVIGFYTVATLAWRCFMLTSIFDFRHCRFFYTLVEWLNVRKKTFLLSWSPSSRSTFEDVEAKSGWQWNIQNKVNKKYCQTKVVTPHINIQATRKDNETQWNTFARKRGLVFSGQCFVHSRHLLRTSMTQKVEI